MITNTIFNLIIYIIKSVIFNIFIFYYSLCKKKTEKKETIVYLNKEIFIYINPWFATNTSFYLLSLAFGLSVRNKQKVILVLDEYQIFNRYEIVSILTNFFIKMNCQLFNLLNKNLSLIIIKNIKTKNRSEIKVKKLREIFKENLYRLTRNENYSLKYNIEKSNSYVKLKIYNKKICKFLESLNKNNFFILPGGIANTTNLYIQYLKKKKINFLTIDNASIQNKYFIFLCLNGISAKREDGYHSFLKDKLNLKKKRVIQKKVFETIKKRSLGKDELKFMQTNTFKIKKKKFVLILLSSGWDSSSLMSHRIFKSNQDWLKKTLDFIENLNIEVVIREHPHLRFKKNKSNDNFQRIFHLYKNVTYFDAISKINTYDLIKKSKFVITTVSSSGIEAAILGKEVLFAGDCIYSKFNFSKKIVNQKKYFHQIKAYLKNNSRLSVSKRNNAMMCYYYCDILKMLPTKFAPDKNFFNYYKMNFLNDFSFQAIKIMINNCLPFPLVHKIIRKM